MKTTKRINTIYWIFTGLFGAFMLMSAIPDIIVMQLAVEGFKELGLPAYFVPFVGAAKALGVVAVVVPGFDRLKEWAYAGLFFDLIAAVYCIISVGKSADNWLPVFLPVIIGSVSYVYYHKRMNAAKNI